MQHIFLHFTASAPKSPHQGTLQATRRRTANSRPTKTRGLLTAFLVIAIHPPPRTHLPRIAMESSSTSHPGLDARQLAAQLPPGFPRGDEAAIDAVMQLAAFTEQQQHQHEQQPPPPPPHQQEHGSKVGGKRRPEGSAGRSSAAKAQRENEGQDAAHQQSWTTFTDHNNEFEHLLQPGEGGHNPDAQSPDQQGGNAQDEGEALTRHGRPLSTTKRAAQNRAAQRAFRERRDQHVREVEAKAKQVDEALASAATHKQRYDELLKTIAGLRADNQSLRLAINALGGNAPPPPPSIANAYTSDTQDDGHPMLSGWREAPQPYQPDDSQVHDQAQGQGQEGRNGEHEKGDSQLDGLSAVAAAAAAAAAHAVGQADEGKQQGGDNEGATK